MDVMTPFVEPLSSKSLTGEASTSAALTTTLSTTFASSIIIHPSSVVINQVIEEDPHSEDPLLVTFEKEELSTSLELQTFHVRGRVFPLRSLSLYAPLPNASMTLYGPSHLGPSLPPSSAWLASLFRSKLIPKASLFLIISTSAVLKVGMTIYTGITASTPYVNENGVSPLLDLIM
ncbi:hypothetical protein Tco_1552730, partial [Tanacetum coccineum]